jgi:hypothetical protein
VDTTPADRPGLPATRARIVTAITSFGVPLSPDDLVTIAGFHDQFIADGLSLQFHTTGRLPQWHYPTLRDLVLAEDGTGRQANYLASEEGFQFLKSLQARDLIVPVVGNLGGTTALPAVARFLRDRGTPLSAFYASNVEYYLWRDGGYGRFLDNLARFAATDNAVVIRSLFGGGGSVSETAPIASLTDTPRRTFRP